VPVRLQALATLVVVHLETTFLFKVTHNKYKCFIEKLKPITVRTRGDAVKAFLRKIDRNIPGSFHRGRIVDVLDDWILWKKEA